MNLSRKTSVAHRPCLLALVLVIATFVAYQPVQHAGFIWDDEHHVTQNVNLRSLHGLYRIWFEPLASTQYYPLQLTSFWIEYHLWGLWPFGYHAVNVLVHGLNAVLLWIVLQQLEVPGAWLAAAVFAVHPVQVESVAWVTELKNLLSTTFYLGAMLAFFRFQPLSGEAPASVPSGRYDTLATVLFLCALLTKTVACSLPAVLLLLIWWKRGRVQRQDIEVLSPMFFWGITFGLMTAWLERYHVGASGAEWSLSFLQRCLLAGHVLWFYAGKLFWPHPLIFIYPHWEIDPGAWWQYTYPSAAFAVLLGLWLLRSQIGRGPLVAVLYFAGTLVPALGFFDVFPFRYSYVADHFQYLACIGLISLAVGTGSAICERAGRWGRDLGTVAAAIVLLMLGATTWRQAHIYRDLDTLWRDTLAKNSDCWLAHNNLGDVLQAQQKTREAEAEFRAALRIKPDHAEAHNNLGAICAERGDMAGAEIEFRAAVRSRPGFSGAHRNLARLLSAAGRTSEAIAQYQAVLRIEPGSAEDHNDLGVALASLGRFDEAIARYEEALRINSDFVEAHYNLGMALEKSGRVPEAAEQYERALKLRPDFVPARNALAQLQAGR